MKLVELEIRNVRGIPDLVLQPNGRNILIYGPNGSGKSAVVDSIDFLLTGRITRLTGEGTGEISLTKHGPHINHQPNEAIVRAKIKIPGLEDPVELERCMGQPSKLEYEDSIKSHIDSIIEVAQRGQYVLTRRDILKYITAPPSTRAKEIQTLLNIQNVENIRKKLVEISGKYERNLDEAIKALDTAKETINKTIENRPFSEEAVMKFINKNRSILKGEPISTLDWRNFKKGLMTPTERPKITLNVKEINNSIEYLQDIISNQDKIINLDDKIRVLIKNVKKKPDLLHQLSRLRLTEMGIILIDETGDCPLCDTHWKVGELKKKLEERISEAKEIERIQNEINEIILKLEGIVDSTTDRINNVLDFLSKVEIKDEIELYSLWLKNLHEFKEILNNVYDRYLESPFDKEMVQRILAPNKIDKSFGKIRNLIKEKQKEFLSKFEITPKQESWDNLTRLEENLKVYEKTMENFSSIEKYTDRAIKLSESFQQAKDDVLSKLYEKISDRFVELYKKLHGNDENSFVASITSDGAGINLEVDFYGYGSHPPHALHSEGHQDSMGLCLYLALAERINKDLINLIILDDVVMSVDAGHRKSICSILTNCFPNHQFLITTHDKTWTNQLKYEGVVNSGEIIEFYNWNIITGPHHFNYQVEIWDPINNDLEDNDVDSAAARLRRGLEQFFGMVCNDLQAPVVFKLDGRYELGDFIRPAIGQHRKLLKKAKVSAQSWKSQEEFERLNELDSNRTQILERTQAERWTIDANVHYNNWINLKVDEFRPVVEAFHDLCLLFKCNLCGGILFVTKKGQIQDSVRCNCGNINWNLIKKN